MKQCTDFTIKLLSYPRSFPLKCCRTSFLGTLQLIWAPIQQSFCPQVFYCIRPFVQNRWNRSSYSIFWTCYSTSYFRECSRSAVINKKKATKKKNKQTLNYDVNVEFLEMGGPRCFYFVYVKIQKQCTWEEIWVSEYI